MVKNGLMWTYLGLDLAFAGGGAAILAVSLTTQSAIKGTQTLSNVAVDLLLNTTPLKGEFLQVAALAYRFVVEY